jgi:hypothetical protein
MQAAPSSKCGVSFLAWYVRHAGQLGSAMSRMKSAVDSGVRAVFRRSARKLDRLQQCYLWL